MSDKNMSPLEALLWLAALPVMLFAICSPGMALATVVALYLDESDIERWMFGGGLGNLVVLLIVWCMWHYGKSSEKPEGEA